MKKLSYPAVLAAILLSQLCVAQDHGSAPGILLRDYKPVSLYHTPQARISKAAFPAIDMHSHDYAADDAEVDLWVRIMDSVGIRKTMILSHETGKGFDRVVKKYGRYPERFSVWCGFNYTGFGKPGWQRNAVAELERCHREGAVGVGELGDKGLGETYSGPVPGTGIHIDDPALKPLLEKCGELHMPVSIHIGEDRWMYEQPDSTNDGMMNAAKWHVNTDRPGMLNHDQLLRSLENAVRDNPHTLFIACHLGNCCTDLQKIGRLLDKYPNLYADIAARYGEIAPVPRYAAAFISKYRHRLVYGTDMGFDPGMYRITFRILESADEHFYETGLFNYHWALYGLDLPRTVLENIYNKNAEALLKYVQE